MRHDARYGDESATTVWWVLLCRAVEQETIRRATRPHPRRWRRSINAHWTTAKFKHAEDGTPTGLTLTIDWTREKAGDTKLASEIDAAMGARDE